MTPKSKLLRMDNVLIVVEDMKAVQKFFAEIGLRLQGETKVEGDWVGSVIGLKDVRADIVMMSTPDGHGKVELTKFHNPPAVKGVATDAPSNTLGIRRVMFAVEGLDGMVSRLQKIGAELVGEVAQYQDIYRLCFMRGPEGIIVGLAEEL